MRKEEKISEAVGFAFHHPQNQLAPVHFESEICRDSEDETCSQKEMARGKKLMPGLLGSFKGRRPIAD
jgi:hypothetical protein